MEIYNLTKSLDRTREKKKDMLKSTKVDQSIDIYIRNLATSEFRNRNLGLKKGLIVWTHTVRDTLKTVQGLAREPGCIRS